MNLKELEAHITPASAEISEGFVEVINKGSFHPEK